MPATETSSCAASRPSPIDTAPILERAPILPVVAIDDPDHAVPLARALADGGVQIIEITLRTPCALEAIERILDEVDGVVVGAGTVTRPEQIEALVRLGVTFAATPGTTPALIDALAQAQLPTLPGVSTVSEAMQLRERGFSVQKLFPARVLGGLDFLRALHPVVPDVRFCPTGGIRDEQIPDYAALPNVMSLGGTWLCPREVVRARDWGHVTRLARFARARASRFADDSTSESSHAHRH